MGNKIIAVVIASQVSRVISQPTVSNFTSAPARKGRDGANREIVRVERHAPREQYYPCESAERALIIQNGIDSEFQDMHFRKKGKGRLKRKVKDTNRASNSSLNSNYKGRNKAKREFAKIHRSAPAEQHQIESKLESRTQDILLRSVLRQKRKHLRDIGKKQPTRKQLLKQYKNQNRRAITRSQDRIRRQDREVKFERNSAFLQEGAVDTNELKTKRNQIARPDLITALIKERVERTKGKLVDNDWVDVQLPLTLIGLTQDQL